MITLKGKLVIAGAVLLGLGALVWRFDLATKWLAPPPKQTVAVSAAALKQKVADATVNAATSVKQVFTPAQVQEKLLAGTNAIAMSGGASIPPVTGVSAYKLELKNGKPVLNVPINIWPGWSSLIVANAGMEANDNSIFYRKYGFYVQLSIVDDPVKARELFTSGYSQVLWGTLDMMAMFAPELCKDSRTVPVIPFQFDFSGGGDGCVARNGLKNINDFRSVNGKKKTVVLAQNSPSQFFFFLMLTDANFDTQEINFIWTADAPSAAKLFVQDTKIDAFVGWSPDIYTVADMVPNTRMVVNSSSANHIVADVCAFRNDFYRDHKPIVIGFVDGVLEGMEMVRKDLTNSVEIVAKAFGLPKADVFNMIGKDGGIATGDAHMTNYRENYKFFLDPLNPNNFESIWAKASTLYQSLGVIETTVQAGKVKASDPILALSDKWKGSTDLSQPNFDKFTSINALELDEKQVLQTAITIRFKAGGWNVDTNYDATALTSVKKIAEIAANFGNAYIIIEGNTDASMRGVVPEDAIKKLSYDRAEGVKNAILKMFPSFDPNKFRVKGNGWDKPLPGCTDATDKEQNKKNRRTEIKVLPLEGD